MKSLNQEIADIKIAKTSKAAKKAALVSLGLKPYEVAIFMRQIDAETPKRERATFTFGVEIECGVPRMALRDAAADTGFAYQYEGYNHRDGQAHFKFVTDSSLSGLGNEIECVSPVLTGTKGRNALKVCCDTLNQAGAAVNRSCGLHVHIGAADLSGQQYANVFVNYRHLEAVIDTFIAPSRRANASQWCATLADHVALESCTCVYEVQTALRHNRYHKVNAQSFDRHQTIEFRQHQGTTNYEKIINWVNFCGKLVVWSKTNRLTAPVTTINDIPFLTQKEKAFFKSRFAQ